MSAPELTSKRAILLDLDRTLIDIESEVDYCGALEALQQAGFSQQRDLGAATSWGDCTRRVVDLLIGQSDRAAWERAEAIVVPFEVAGAERALPMPGLTQFWPCLQGRSVGVVTLASKPATERAMARYRLKVDAIEARSFDVPAKPNPEQLLVTLEALGIEPKHAVMVGDSERDEVAAVAAGIDFVGVTNGRDQHDFAAQSVVVADLIGVAGLLLG